MLKKAHELYSEEVLTSRKSYRRYVMDFIHVTQYHDDVDAWSKNEHRKNHGIVSGLLLNHEKMVRHFFDCESMDDERIAELLYRFNTFYLPRRDRSGDAAKVPAQEQTAEPAKATVKLMSPRRRMPEILSTATAKEYFDKAREIGLLDIHYNWLGSDALLACFCAGMSLTLGLSARERDGKIIIRWKPFDEMFGVSTKGGLRGNFKNIANTNDPNGLMKLFEMFPKLQEYMRQQ